jgi:hypothetical protein
MEQVIPFLQDLCEMQRFGGRCVRTDCGCWEIFDIAQWTEDHAAALRKRFPSIAPRVVGSRTSLSGFSVVLQVQKSSHVWTSLLVVSVMVAILGGIVFAMG